MNSYYNITKLFTQRRKRVIIIRIDRPTAAGYDRSFYSIMEYITNSEKETETIGEQFGRRVKDGTVVAMYGDLGAGKTAFVRGMARGMGIDARVSSPTFTIVNEYLGERTLIHFDMYRLGSADELFDIGWEDYLARGAVCAVEWSENVEDAFFGDEVRLTIEKLSDTGRKITSEEGTPC